MKKAQNELNWLRVITTFVLLVVAFSVSGCGSEETAPAVEDGPEAVEVAVVEVQATETAVAVKEADEADVAEVAVTETAVTEELIDECLACHIDKEMLIATADPEEEVISENEGEG